jgi:predicted metal-dependent HD superfamily phosphohydrolase
MTMPHEEKQALIALQQSWQRLWLSLEAQGDGGVLAEALLKRYAEPWRKYHTVDHLVACIRHFSDAGHLGERPAEVEAALWFHDAVYELGAHDNEQHSANWAQTALLEHGVRPDAAHRIAQLVLMTQHTAVPKTLDERLLVDVDLSILGAPAPEFQAYEDNIRVEYAFVPEGLFQVKRREVMRSFAARPFIYQTAHFRQRLERQARENLRRYA